MHGGRWGHSALWDLYSQAQCCCWHVGAVVNSAVQLVLACPAPPLATCLLHPASATPETTMTDQQLMALHHPCFLAAETVNPRYGITHTNYSVIITVNAGYE